MGNLDARNPGSPRQTPYTSAECAKDANSEKLILGGSLGGMAAEALRRRRPRGSPTNQPQSSPRQNAEAPARAEELGWVAEIYPKLALWARLRRGGSASGPMPSAHSRLPRDACLVSAYSMLPSSREIPPNLPPGPSTYKEAAQIRGALFEPAHKEDLQSGGEGGAGAFVLHHAGHAAGLVAYPSRSGDGLGEITGYDGNFPGAWRAELCAALRILPENDATSGLVLFRVWICDSAAPDHPFRKLLAGSDAPTSDTIILSLQKELSDERERFWKSAQAHKGSGGCY